jgi:penicillin amidase
VPPYRGGLGDQAWRMITLLGPAEWEIDARAIYPGGQSENPASPWYRNLTGRWRTGRYLALPSAAAVAAGRGGGRRIRWELLP